MFPKLTTDQKILCKIKGVPANYDTLPFGRQIEYHGTIGDFKARAKSTWLSQKRKSWRTALKEFKSLHKGVREYYAQFYADPHHYDDSFQLWYIEDTANDEGTSS